LSTSPMPAPYTELLGGEDVEPLMHIALDDAL
jgi:hypothetical protein